MRTTPRRSLAASAALALSIALVPGALNAQEAAEQAECTAEVSPAQVQAGQKAVQVTAALSSPIGSGVALEAPAESGIALASPADVPKSEMAAEGETPRPIELTAEGGGQVTIWLNTENAERGTHEVTLKGGEKACTAQITVSGGSSG